MSIQLHTKYRPDIDGLRAVAVWAVLIFHAFPSDFAGGFVGVDIFFVISGFLISRILIEDIAADRFTLRDFYARRIKRIFPALILVMSVTAIAGWVILVGDEMNQLGLHIAAGAGFVSNLILWSESGYFDTASELKPLLHLWSLGIEEQFYIFWPLLLWGAFKLRVPILASIVGIALTSFILNIVMIDDDPTATFYSPITRAWELLFGSLLAWISLHSTWLKDKQSSLVSHVLSVTGAALLAGAMLIMTGERSFPGWWALMPVVGATCLIGAGQNGVINRYVLSTRPMVWFGLISFPLYLWHWPLLSFGQIVDGQQTKVGYRLVALLLSVLFAWLTVACIERPMRHGIMNAKFKIYALCGLMAALGLGSLWIHHADLSTSHTFQTRMIERKSRAIGESINWYAGKDGWLFLGDGHDKSLSKLQGYSRSTADDINAVKKDFAAVTQQASKYGIKVAFLLGPNKSTVYPEYLPDGVNPAASRYAAPFLAALRDIPDLVVYDPTEVLRKAKSDEAYLYYRTDTHWNAKGAYIAIKSLQQQLGLDITEVEFEKDGPFKGDIIGIAKINDFPLRPGDAWTPVYSTPLEFSQHADLRETTNSFGSVGTVRNTVALVDEKIWIIGDSFTSAMRQYLNATYREVVYIGHWAEVMKDMPSLIQNETDKPDRILIERVERSF